MRPYLNIRIHSSHGMPASDPRPDLVLCNARVITLNDGQPAAEMVAIREERIVWVGSNEDLDGLATGDTEVVDCRGQTLVSGFVDAHCHIMAYASSLQAVDCGASAVTSIDGIKQALKDRAAKTSPGEWVRGVGYNEFALNERRHPSRHDLDDAAPHHPLRLNHRSGHASVLNSVALARVGISTSTPEPDGGVIQRDWDTGEPTGLLLEMDDHLSKLVPPLSEEEFRRGMAMANERLMAVGITSVQDATNSNSTERWDDLRRLKAEGGLSPRVTMMAGSDHLQGFLDRGLGFGSGDGLLNLGAVKIMLTRTGGALRPSSEELVEIVGRAHEAGFQVAIHAVEADAVEAAVATLIGVPAERPQVQPSTRDRIEHCSECPPDSLHKLAGSGLVVVTQPGFLYYNGERYLSEVPGDMQPWLYRIKSFQESGLNPACSSDAPVIEPNPMVGIYAAVTRRAESGQTVGGSERVSAREALKMYTLNGAFASRQEAAKGSIEAGKLADLVLLDRDPTRVESDCIPHIKVTMTIIGGQVVWQA